MFASKYHELYTSVSYDIVDMKNIPDELNSSIHYAGYDCISFVNTADVIHACNKLKLGKRDGTIGLWSDHFIHGCSELATHISQLFSSMLIHGVAPDDMCSSTIIPIPKGKHANVTDSSNYRGIALSSIFGKVFDLIFLDKYSDCLCTSELQFGFKAGHSTDMCSMVLKGTLAYYVVDGGSAFCMFLDATKAFDRIDYCKLFRELLRRDLPAIYVRLLCNRILTL